MVVRGGDLYLAVWTDWRSRLAGYDVYGARLDAQGNLIDTFPIPILLDGSGQIDPAVAWNGSNWLVAVEDESDPVGVEPRLRAVRVSPQGQVLDATPIVIASNGNGGSIATMASDGSNWAVFWTGTSGGQGAVKGARISPAGVVLDPGGKVVLPETYFVRYYIDASFAGGRYLLAYNDSSAMKGILLNGALDPAGPSPFTIFTDTYALTRIASSGMGFFACASAPGWYVYYKVVAARITTAGQVLDTTPIQIVGDAQFGSTAHATYDGTNWIVGWSHPGLRLARVSPAGIVLDPGGVAVDPGHASSHGAPFLAPGAGGGAQLVWTDNRNGLQDVFAARVNGNLGGGAAAGINLSAPRQDAPRLAGNGAVSMLVFRSTIAGQTSIKATLLDAAGNFILPEPIVVATLGDVFTNPPGVAWDGVRFLVVWSPGGPGQNQIVGRRFQVDGGPIDAAPIFIMNGLDPDVAGLDGQFLVVGTHGPGYPQYRFTYAVRVRGSDGAVLGSPVPLAPPTGDVYAMRPRVAAFGSRWLVAWQGRWTHDNPWARIRANFVDANGVAGTDFVAADPNNYNYAPSIAVGEGIALISFQSTWNGTCCWDIYGCRFDENGVRLDPPGGRILVSSAQDQTEPNGAWDGEQFLVLFQDRRHAPTNADQRPHLYGTRVLADGSVLDPAGFVVAAEAVPESGPAILGPPPGRNGTALLAYCVLAPLAPYASERIVVRQSGVEGAAIGGPAVTMGVARAFPNPTTGRVQLAGVRGDAVWEIFDSAGRSVRRFHGVSWDGRGDDGRPAPPGVYYAPGVRSRLRRDAEDRAALMQQSRSGRSTGSGRTDVSLLPGILIEAPGEAAESTRVESRRRGGLSAGGTCHRRAARAVFLLPLLLGAVPVTARQIYLHPDGSGDLPTLSAALLAAKRGNTLTLAAGRYAGDGNRATKDGGAVSVSVGGVEFTRCLFAGNRAEERGGAAHLCCCSIPHFNNCTSADNAAPDGGAFNVTGISTLTLSRCIVAFNGPGAAIACSEGVMRGYRPRIDHTDVFGNTGGDWAGCLDQMLAAGGNLSADPQFLPDRSYRPAPDSPVRTTEGLLGARE